MHILILILYRLYLRRIGAAYYLDRTLKEIYFLNKFSNSLLILYDLLLCLGKTTECQKYIIFLFLKLKYSKTLQKFNIQRPNVIWALRRNFFILHITQKCPIENGKLLKYYVILRQLLDDRKDRLLDMKNNLETIYSSKALPQDINANYIKHLEHNIKNFLNREIKRNPNSICSKLINFYLQLL